MKVEHSCGCRTKDIEEVIFIEKLCEQHKKNKIIDEIIIKHSDEMGK